MYIIFKDYRVGFIDFPGLKTFCLIIVRVSPTVLCDFRGRPGSDRDTFHAAMA